MKYLALILSLIISVTISGCDEAQPTSSTQGEEQQSSTSSTSQEQSSEEAANNSSATSSTAPSSASESSSQASITVGVGVVSDNNTEAATAPTTSEQTAPVNLPEAELTLTSAELNSGTISAFVGSSYKIAVTAEEGSVIDIYYPENDLDIATDGGLIITPTATGTFTVTVTASADGFATAEETITLQVSKEPLYLTLSAQEITFSPLLTSAIIEVNSNVLDFDIDLAPSTGIVAQYNNATKTIEITASNSGNLAVQISSDGYDTITKNITINYATEPVGLALSNANVALSTSVPTQNISVITSAPSPTITLNATSGLEAVYNASSKTVSISGTVSGSVTVTASQNGYTSESAVIYVSYALPNINATLSANNVTIVGNEEVVLEIEITNVRDSEVKVTSTAGVNADFYETGPYGGELILSASRNGTVSIEISANGFNSVLGSVNVSYEEQRNTQLTLALDKSAVTITDSPEYVAMTMDNLPGTSIELSTLGDITAEYIDGNIKITATGSGVLRVTLSKDGYQSVSSEVTVTYAGSSAQTGASENSGEIEYLGKPEAILATSKVHNESALQAEVLRLVNEIRVENGLNTFGGSATLDEFADIRSDEIVHIFSHDRPNGESFSTVFTRTEGNVSFGENLAMGYPTAQEVVDGWMNSPGHKENILTPHFDEMGIGISEDVEGYLYWTQLFWGDTTS